MLEHLFLAKKLNQLNILLMKKTILLLCALILIGINSQGQNTPSVDIIGGVGLPESFHIGAKIQALQKSQFGLYYGNGLHFSNNYSYNTFSLDHQYHFGKSAELSPRQVWFFRQGLSYGIDNSEYSNHHYLLLNLSIGREFNITPKIGISADIGFFRVLTESETIKDSNKEPWVDINPEDFFVLPVIRVQVFYSL